MKNLLKVVAILISLLACEEDPSQPDCVDPDLIDPDAFCTEEYAPVCGCDETTYPNSCYAEKNGVLNYDIGPCATDANELSNAFLKWENSEISNYSFKLDVHCFCMIFEPYSIDVENGELVSYTGNSGWGHETFPFTIQEMFDFIYDAEQQEPFQSQISYDSTHGYPKEIYFDFDELTADEEIGFTIRDFVINN